MKKKLIIGICLMLVTIGCLSGCTEEEQEELDEGFELIIFGKVIDIDAFGGAPGCAPGVVLIFQSGEIVSIYHRTSYKVQLNVTGTYIFHKYAPRAYLFDIKTFEREENR